MKLPDFLQWPELNALREQMGARRLGTFRLVPDPNRLTEAELKQLVQGGIDVSVDEVRVLPDGTLAYKDSRVLVYIRDVTIYKRARSARVHELPRFHLANCDTLQQMRQDNRYERYVVATPQNGLFAINFIQNGRAIRSSAERLRVCQNCLHMLAFDGFQRNMPKAVREERVAQFKLEGFFEKYPRALIFRTPTHRADSGPLNVYPTDFDERSTRAREERGWCCQRCGFIAGDPALRRYLHVHHVNGLKYDNRPENLLVLCLGCHADEPHHSHMKSLPEYEAFVRLRSRSARNGKRTRPSSAVNR